MKISMKELEALRHIQASLDGHTESDTCDFQVEDQERFDTAIRVLRDADWLCDVKFGYVSKASVSLSKCPGNVSATWEWTTKNPHAYLDIYYSA